MDPAAYQVIRQLLAARKKGAAEAVSLPGADLSDADLIRADLLGANLSGAGLDHAKLAGAKLAQADLTATQMRWCELNGADLTAADLRNADLSWARLEGASLADADLRGASVDGAVGEPTTVAGARIDKVLCERSHLDDTDVIQLWRAGAIIEDLEQFSPAVQNACSLKADAKPKSGSTPSARRVSQVELLARRNKLDLDAELASAAQLARQQAEANTKAGISPNRSLSIRSLKLVSSVITPAMIDAPAWREGDTVLGATLESLIGEGNAAQVWRGTTEDGESVAVKLFDAKRTNVGLTLPSYRRGVAVMNRLTAQADKIQRAARVRGVSLNQLGFVMDLAPNGSAVDLPALGWSVASALAFFEKLCDAMQEAHALGVLHRCLKPSNILLDEDLNPLLADFDMADLSGLAQRSLEAGGYTYYAAPEELLGAGTQSPTADIFSLGRFFYFVLSGKHPQEAPAQVPLLAALSEFPEGLVRIIRKCTMSAPERRYQFVSELLADLSNYEDADSVGVSGDAALSQASPSSLSTLSHSTPWLGGRSEAPASLGAPASIAAAAQRNNTQRPRPEPKEAGAGMARATEKLVGVVGIIVLLVSFASVELAAEASKPSLARIMRPLSAVGGAMASFWVPLTFNRAWLWRLLVVVLAAVSLFLLDLPALFAGV